MSSARETSDVVVVPRSEPETQYVGMSEGNSSHGRGGMGLTGLWAQVANMSAVGVLCVIAFLVIQDGQRTATAEREARRSEATEERKLYQAELKSQREVDERRTAAIIVKLDGMTSEIRAAVSEIRTARIAMQQAHPPMDECEEFPPQR